MGAVVFLLSNMGPTNAVSSLVATNVGQVQTGVQSVPVSAAVRAGVAPNYVGAVPVHAAAVAARNAQNAESYGASTINNAVYSVLSDVNSILMMATGAAAAIAAYLWKTSRDTVEVVPEIAMASTAGMYIGVLVCCDCGLHIYRLCSRLPVSA